MLDSALFSAHGNASIVHVTFADWIPLMLSSLGMIVINSVDKARLSSESSFSFGGSSSTADWQAKVVLFLGFALLAGGISGSIIILILRYVIHHYGSPTIGMGIENVVANGCVIISGIALWLAQNLEDEYSYSLQL